MTVLDYRQPTRSDIEIVATYMRDADVVELRELGREDPHGALKQSVENSAASFTILAGDTPLGVVGVGGVGLLGGVGAPWLLGTEGLRAQRRALILDGREIISSWARRYQLLQNVVSVRNEMSVRWLHHMGFAFGEPFNTPFGGRAVTFYMEGTRNV